MARNSSNSNTSSATPAGAAAVAAPTDATNGGTASGATATATAGGESAPPAGERRRFSICSKKQDGTAGDVIATTNSPTLAYSNRCAGRYVIDHANGDREYDGKNPAREEERKAEKEAIQKASKK